MNPETLETVEAALRNFGIDTTCGTCMAIAYTGVGLPDAHTCKLSQECGAGIDGGCGACTACDPKWWLELANRENEHLRDVLKRLDAWLARAIDAADRGVERNLEKRLGDLYVSKVTALSDAREVLRGALGASLVKAILPQPNGSYPASDGS